MATKSRSKAKTTQPKTQPKVSNASTEKAMKVEKEALSLLKRMKNEQDEFVKKINRFDVLKEEIVKIVGADKESLALEVELKEIEVKERMDALDAQMSSYEQTMTEKENKLQGDFEAKKKSNEAKIVESNAAVDKVKQDNARELEEIQYQHNKAIERQNVETAKAIANSLSMSIITNSEKESLEKKADALDKAEKDTTSAFTQKDQAESKLKDAEADAKTAKKISDAEITSLKKEVASLREDKTKLEKTIEEMRKENIESLKAVNPTIVTQSSK